MRLALGGECNMNTFGNETVLPGTTRISFVLPEICGLPCFYMYVVLVLDHHCLTG